MYLNFGINKIIFQVYIDEKIMTVLPKNNINSLKMTE